MAANPALKRALGPAALVFYGVGDILGAGIYALVGKVAGAVGPAVWLSFAAAFAVSALTALSYAELSSRYPRAAGAAAYTLEAFGSPFISYAVGGLVLFSGIVSMAAASHAFSGYFGRVVPGASAAWVIAGFFVVLAAVNLKGIRESSRANVVCTLIEVAGLAIVIAAGARFFGHADVTSVRPPAGTAPAAAVLQGGALAFYAFIGFEDVVNVAEEATDSRKALPRAILLSLGIGSAIYVLVALAAVSAVSPAELAASDAPLVGVVARGFPGFPLWIFSAIALFAVANTALLNFVMGSRLLYGLSSDGLAPAAFGRIHPITGTPHAAIGAVFAAALVLAYSGTLAVLAQATSVLLLTVFFLVHASLAAIKRRGSAEAGLTIPAAVPYLGMAATLGLVFFVEARAFGIFAAVLAVVAATYFFNAWKKRR